MTEQEAKGQRMAGSLLIFGATGRTGSWVLQYAQQTNRPCVALVRNLKKASVLNAIGHKAILGDACNKRHVDLACMLAGKESTIISTMGGEGVNYEGHRNVIDCAEKAGIKRMIMVTSIGCGNTWDTLSERAKKAFGPSVREKSLAEVWLQTSSLDYCILRPAGLLAGEPTGRAQYFEGEEVHGFIRRSDLAGLILNQASQHTLGRRIYSVVDPELENSAPE